MCRPLGFFLLSAYVVLGVIPVILPIGPSIAFQPAILWLVIVAFAAILLLRHGLVALNSAVLSLALLLGYLALTASWSVEKDTSLFSLAYLAYLSSGALSAYVIALYADVNSKTLAYVFAGALACFLVYYLAAYGMLSDRIFPYDSNINPTWYGAFCAFAILLLAPETENPQTRYLAFALIIFAAAGLMLTQSRNAMVALSLALFYFFFLQFDRHWPRRAGVAILLLFVVGAAAVIGGHFLGINIPFNRTARFFEFGNLGLLTTNRFFIWSEAMNMGANPIIGSGWGTFALLHPMEKTAHNMYLGLFIETGVIGVLLFLGALAALWISSPSRHTKAMVIFMAALSFGNDTLTYKYWWLPLFFALVAIWESRMQISPNLSPRRPALDEARKLVDPE